MLNGSHWELYFYDEVSGRLESVLDLQTGEVNEFEWNPEGTLARWSEPNTGYDRVFGYDEEGRLVRIERDYGNGNKQVAYEYGYNSDGGKVWTREYFMNQLILEFRFITCGTGCAGTPLSLYMRTHGGEMGGSASAWSRAEEYVNTPTVLMYDFVLYPGSSGDIVHYDGNMIMPQYRDSSGILVGGYALPNCALKRDREAGCVPYGTGCPSVSTSVSDLPYLNSNGVGGFPQNGFTTNHYVPLFFILPPLLIAALRGCLAGAATDTLLNIAKWLGCAIGSIITGKPVTASCGSFPIPGLCDVVASCLTGALTGGILEKILPRLKDIIRDIIAGLVGNFGGGFCQGVTAPCSTPSPAPAPKPPKPPSPPSGGGGVWRPLPAV